MTEAASLGEARRAWQGPQILAASIAALAFAAEGLGTQIMGLAMPAILKDWGVTRSALATPTALGLVGFALGAVLGGIAGDRFGRRRTLMASLVVTGLATMLCAVARDTADLGLVRILVGLGLGATLPGAATVLAEAAPPRQRSLAIAIGLSFLPLGGFVGGMASTMILPALGWRGLFAVAGGVILLAALIVPACGPVAGADVADVPPREAVGASLRRILAAGELRNTIGLWGAFFFTVQFYYAVFSWVPAALASLGLPGAVGGAALSAFAICGLAGGLVAGALTQRFGSRPALLAHCGVAMIAALLLAFLSRSPADGAVVIAAIGLLGGGIIGVQSILYAVASHLHGAAARATGTGLAVGWGRIGACTSAYVGAAALDRGGVPVFFAILAAAALLALGCGLAVSRPIEARA